MTDQENIVAMFKHAGIHGVLHDKLFSPMSIVAIKLPEYKQDEQLEFWFDEDGMLMRIG